MNRRNLALLILVSISIPLIVGFCWIFRPKGYIENPAEVDTSWVGKVNDILKEAEPHVPINDSNRASLAFARIFLYKNGTEQLVNLTRASSEPYGFIDYLEELLSKVNALKNASITWEYAEKV
jgi:hypothetical protein